MNSVMTPPEMVDWLHGMIDRFDNRRFGVSIADSDPLASFLTDELRWREEVDSAIRELLNGGDPSGLSQPVQYYCTIRMNQACWALIPLVYNIPLPAKDVLSCYLLEFWPGVMLPHYLRSVLTAHHGYDLPSRYSGGHARDPHP